MAITLSSIKYWSLIRTGSGTGGLPSSVDDIIITGNDSLTVDKDNAICHTLTIGNENGSGILRFTSTGKLTITDLTLGSSAFKGSIDMSAGGTLYIAGSITVKNLGSWNNKGGEVQYIGLYQDIYPTNYNNLRLSGGGKKSLLGGTTVTSTLTIEENTILDLTYALNTNDLGLFCCTSQIGSSIVGDNVLTIDGNITVNKIGSGSNGSIISCPLSLGTSTKTFTVNDDGSARDDLVISGAISGPSKAGLTKSGTGILVLSGTNTFSGKVTVNQGTLKMGSSTALGSIAEGTVVNDGATLDLNGTLYSYDEPLVLSGSGVSSMGALVNNSSDQSSFNGLISLTGAETVLISGNQGLIALTNTGTITGPGINIDLAGSKGGSLVAPIGTGGGTVSKDGTGTWILSGNSTYTGNTLINSGTLKIGVADSPLGTTGSGTKIYPGASLDLNGYSLATAESLSLQGKGTSGEGALSNSSPNTVSYKGNITLNASCSIGSVSTITLSGTISGSAYDLTKVGSGTLIWGSSSNMLFVNNLTISSGMVSVISGTMNISGSVINNGTFILNNGLLTISKDLINNGTFCQVKGTTSYIGTDIQKISGTSEPFFNNLSINNANGLNLEINSTVSNTLTFISGKISTGSNFLSIGCPGKAGTVTGTSTTCYINGNLKQYVPDISNPTIKFDIGDVANYIPLLVTFSGNLTGSGYIEASTSNNIPPVEAGLSQTRYIKREWHLTNFNVLGITSYKPVFSFVGVDKTGDLNLSSVIVRKISDKGWENISSACASTTIQCTGLTRYGNFYAGEPGEKPSADSLPANLNVCPNSKAQITVITVTVPTPSIQWQVSTDHGATWNDINDGIVNGIQFEGSSTETLSFEPVSVVMSGYRIRAKLTNINGSAVTNETILNVLEEIDDPVSNGNITICSDEPMKELEVTVKDGETADWYTEPVDGILLVSGSENYLPSAPGTFYIQARNSSTGCVSSNRTAVKMDISEAAYVNAGPDQVICSCNPIITLNGSIDGSATLGIWSGGNGLYSPGTSSLNVQYTPTQAEINSGIVTLALTTDDPPGECGKESDQVVITFIPCTKMSVQNGDWGSPETWIPKGAPEVNEDILVRNIVDVGNNSSDSPALCHNLVISSSGELTIDSGNALTVSGDLNNSAGISGLLIQSEGSLIHHTKDVLATVFRDILGGNENLHQVSSPVISPVLSSIFPLDSYVKEYDEPSQYWASLKGSDYMKEGLGYFLLLQNFSTATFTGNLISEDVEITGLSNTNGINDGWNGWNLIGNPYTSALDVSKPVDWEMQNVDACIYVWDNIYGNYLFVNTTVSNSATLTDGIIPAEQGFFVHVTDKGTGSLKIKESDRTHSSHMLKSNPAPENTLNIEVKGNNYADRSILCYIPGSTERFDPTYDAFKIEGLDQAPQLYFTIPDNKLSMNALPSIDSNNLVPLSLKVGAQASYTLSFSGIESFSKTIPLYLDDLKSGISMDLRQSLSYTFMASPEDDPERFRIRLKSDALGIPEPTLPNISIYAYSKNIVINNADNKSGWLTIYNSCGQIIETRKLSHGIQFYPISCSGIYFVKIIAGQVSETKKVVIIF